MKKINLCCLFVLILMIETCRSVKEAKMLYSNIISKAMESKFWRPVKEDKSAIFVYLGMSFLQIMDVDEKNQILTMSVQIRQIWKNKYLSWNPEEYGNMKSIYLPHDKLWLPDIVLINNADGKYETQFSNKPILYYNGLIDWKSPTIVHSTCEIDVKNFPYDEQICYLKFGSWTYNKQQLKLRHVKQMEVFLNNIHWKNNTSRNKLFLNNSRQQYFEEGAFLNNYYRSGEWDLMKVPAISSGDGNETTYDFIKFGVKIRRKIMFHNVNYIFPILGICLLGTFKFLAPAKKVDISTLIVSAIAVFFVLISESVPSSSLFIPIINQYLIFSLLILFFSTMCVSYVLSFRFRSHFVDDFLPKFLQNYLLRHLPQILFKKVPPKQDFLSFFKMDFMNYRKNEKPTYCLSRSSTLESLTTCFDKYFVALSKNDNVTDESNEPNSDILKKTKTDNSCLINHQIKEACLIIREITDGLMAERNDKENEYSYTVASVVLDRIFLFIFGFLNVCVVLATFLQSPILYDYSSPLNESTHNDFNLNRLLLQQL